MHGRHPYSVQTRAESATLRRPSARGQWLSHQTEWYHSGLFGIHRRLIARRPTLVECSGGVARAAEYGEDVLVKLEPYVVDRIQRRLAPGLLLPLVNQAHGPPKTADVRYVAGNCAE